MYRLRQCDRMKSELNRLIFTKRRRYKSLEMQQGLVQLDVDWSEKLDLQVHDEFTYLEVWERNVKATEDNSTSDAVNPEAMPLSSGETSPMISDWVSGFERFIRKTRTR